MPNNKSLTEHLLYLLKGDGAHLDFESAIKDLPAALRGKRPKDAPHSPWEVLEHLRITQRDILDTARTPNYTSPEFPAGYWPLTPAPPDAAAWDKTFEVNLKGAFAATRAVVEHLRSRKAPGAIVNLASVVGLRAAPLQGVYGMTKAALISMTRTLAQELGPEGIRVNAIAPGLVETRFAGTLVSNEALRDRFVSRTALGRHAQPDEIAGAALYLASDASGYVTGHVLVVDGGTTVTL